MLGKRCHTEYVRVEDQNRVMEWTISLTGVYLLKTGRKSKDGDGRGPGVRCPERTITGRGRVLKCGNWYRIPVVEET